MALMPGKHQGVNGEDQYLAVVPRYCVIARLVQTADFALFDEQLAR